MSYLESLVVRQDSSGFMLRRESTVTFKLIRSNLDLVLFAGDISGAGSPIKP